MKILDKNWSYFFNFGKYSSIFGWKWNISKNK